MAAKNFKTVSDARERYAVLSESELSAKPIPELRKIAVEIDTGRIDRDGTTVRINSARKNELVKAILEATAEKRLLNQVISELDQSQLDAISDATAYLDEVSQSDLGKLAKTTWEKLRAYSVSRWDAQTQTWKATDGGLLNIAFDFVNGLKNKRSTKTGEVITDTTVLAYKASIFKAIEQYLSFESQHPHFKMFSEYLAEFKAMVNQSLAHMTKAKKAVQTTRLNERKRSVAQVSIKALLAWAEKTLADLSDDTADSRWADVSLALMLVTGRRQSEIQSSASFRFADDHNVWFSGQLKTKDREVSEYLIPVLTDAQNVVKGLNWLDNRGKRNPDPKVAHSRYSKALSGKAAELNKLMEVIAEPDLEKPTALKCHLCRQLYAQVAATRFKPDHLKLRTYLADILGHSPEDDNTAGSYDADVEVVEA